MYNVLCFSNYISDLYNWIWGSIAHMLDTLTKLWTISNPNAVQYQSCIRFLLFFPSDENLIQSTGKFCKHPEPRRSGQFRCAQHPRDEVFSTITEIEERLFNLLEGNIHFRNRHFFVNPPSYQSIICLLLTAAHIMLFKL